ncbi:MAG TPA: inositol monophosphatase family protein [Myxococcaceae bacterium]|nr:inositol monophosphatase family protein [Myxococcaceae bacterium]
MTVSLDTLLETAVEGARRAGRVLADRFHQPRTIDFKGGIDLVTDADRASETVLLEWLRARHPDHAILSEESGASAGSIYRWIIDPLDGTTNYAHTLPHFSVTIAVEGEGGIQVGVVYDPMRDELFSAVRGRGAMLNGRPIRPSSIERLDRALLCTGFPYDVREHPEGPAGLIARFLGVAQGIRRLGSAALDLAYVASGRYDGYFEFNLKPWDVAAGALICWEAGAVASRIDGEPYDTSVVDVLAAAPRVAPALTEECRRFLAEIRWRPEPFR